MECLFVFLPDWHGRDPAESGASGRSEHASATRQRGIFRLWLAQCSVTVLSGQDIAYIYCFSVGRTKLSNGPCVQILAGQLPTRRPSPAAMPSVILVRTCCDAALHCPGRCTHGRRRRSWGGKNAVNDRRTVGVNEPHACSPVNTIGRLPPDDASSS